ncbi:hypothetical protein HZF05_03255 [Sphingomonas sp. CGMCC 1.13654]|uniref:Uncharacterized protein n=1 Tax=Sphingomonas chungangi TaxID=2683589 RepID=A0A838L6A1_9SPHN|nr:hypothetical protein [Sphingomonas chungangi]MBA2933108.1 hypothetical protein [Sphingomonas chungangi]MVW56728.1 hypothetical protein [Sphingomonas chungangi]
MITAIGAVVLLTARPIWTLQMRTLERQLDWYRRHPTLGVNFFRFFGGMFLLIGIATFFKH